MDLGVEGVEGAKFDWKIRGRTLVWVLVGRGTGLTCLEQSPGVGCPKRGIVRWLRSRTSKLEETPV